MTLRLSNLSLRAIVVLVVSRQKGITLVFKNDPLERVDVSSSFDGVESVAGFIQSEIENQLREAFRSDLPSVIHRLSQKWLSGEVKSAGQAAHGSQAAKKVGGLVGEGFDRDAKIETRTAYYGGPNGGFDSAAGQPTAEVTGLNGNGDAGSGGRPPRGKAHRRRMSARDSEMGESIDLDGSQADSTWSTWGGGRMHSRGTSLGGFGSSAGSDSRAGGSTSRTPSLRRVATTGGRDGRGRRNSSAPPSVSHDQLDSVPESIESYDPTYGLRPDSIPQHAGFQGYEKLVRQGSSRRGLGDVLEDAVDEGRTDQDQRTRRRRRRAAEGFETGDVFDGVNGFAAPDPGSSPEADFWDPSDGDSDLDEPVSPFETIPAVGGGTITRPRVFHTQSQMRVGPSLASPHEPASNGSLSAHGSPSSRTARSAAGGSTASTVGLGRSASFYAHARSGSGGFGAFAPHFHSAASSSISIPTSARFPFPRQGPPPSYSAYGSPRPGSSIVRNTSMPALSRMTSGASMMPRASSSLDRGTPQVASPRMAPPPQFASADDDADEPDRLAFTRPSPVDLLSRSPSSLLNTSFLDEEHLPITLNPSGNDSCAHLATLTSSNQTLSPFTRDHAHVTARSSPHQGGLGAADGIEGSNPSRVAVIGAGQTNGAVQQQQQPPQPVKGVRKRLHRIGAAKKAHGGEGDGGSISSMSQVSAGGFPSPRTSPGMPSSPTMDGHFATPMMVHSPSGRAFEARYPNARSASTPSSAAVAPGSSHGSSRPAPNHRRSVSSSLSPTRYGTTRPAPSPFQVTRGRVSLAADYGPAMGTPVSAGVGGNRTGSSVAGGSGASAAKTAPSELSDYFPPAAEVVGGGAREMLSRMGLQ